MNSMLDVHFALSGEYLPQRYHDGLLAALCGALPWLAIEPDAGMHFVRVSENGDRLLLSRRARLMLRLPQHRLEDAQRLVDTTLQVGDSHVRVGQMHEAPFAEHPTLHAQMAVATSSDEGEFLAEMESELAGLGLPGKLICGRPQLAWLEGAPCRGYSLVIYGLKPAHALLLQQRGLGRHRKYGCGMFIPYKEISGIE